MTLKHILAGAALFLATACTSTEQRIEVSRNLCAQVGHAAGTPDHTACVERGVRASAAGDRAATGNIARLISIAALFAL